jgi:hypothetical protein
MNPRKLDPALTGPENATHDVEIDHGLKLNMVLFDCAGGHIGQFVSDLSVHRGWHWMCADSLPHHMFHKTSSTDRWNLISVATHSKDPKLVQCSTLSINLAFFVRPVVPC